MLSFRHELKSATPAPMLALLATATVSGESVAELDDAAARMQYAFYTGDSQGIETILKNLEQFQVEDSLAANKAYQLAYGNWKLSQLYLQPLADQQPRPNGKSLASKAAQTCVREARRALAARRMQKRWQSRQCATDIPRRRTPVRQDARTASRCAQRMGSLPAIRASSWFRQCVRRARPPIQRQSSAGAPSSRASKPHRRHGRANLTGATWKR